MCKNSKNHLKISLILGVLFFLLYFMIPSINATTSKAVTTLRYSGKTHKNLSNKLSVYYGKKVVSNKNYKAIKIKKNYMVSYSEVFKKGIKCKTSLSANKKKLSLTKNGVKLTLYIGKKTAYVNGKKIKLNVAPLSVKYVKKKKTKILVPIKTVCKYLKINYSLTSSAIKLKKPLLLTIDNVTDYYSDIQGDLFYNHKLYKLKTLPVIKLQKKKFFPAKEVLETIMNLDYSYDEKTGLISIINEDTNQNLSFKYNSTSANYNNEKYTFKTPGKIVTNVNDKKKIVMLSATDVFKCLQYSYGWYKNNNYYFVQSGKFFEWNKELKNSQLSDSANNYIYSMIAKYETTGSLNAINLKIKGTVSEILKTSTIKRDGNTIKISIPTSKYLCEKNTFNKFGEIIEKLDITEENGSVIITMQCYDVADYSYVISSNTLEINILRTYKNTSGSVTNYSISITKPSGVSILDVSNEDLYNKKTFKIYIKGNYVEFFKANPVIIGNNKIKNLTVTKSGSNTVITVKTSSLQGYKIFEQGSKFVVSMNKPNKIYKNIIVLDAGHGGYDAGASKGSTKEKDLNLKIIYTNMKKYFSSNAPETKVYWTRTTDSFITLADRAAFAKKVGADIFISLHMNSATSSSAHGNEVYYSVSNNSKSFSGLTSKTMATFFRSNLLFDLDLSNRGTKSAGYYVLRHNTVPAILIELGFMSNSSDLNKLKNATFQQNAAKSIYNSINALFNKYPTGRNL